MISFNDLKGFSFLSSMQRNLYTIAGEDGSAIISFKTLLKAEYKSNGAVVFEPIEQNSFATYNKTTEPKEFYFEVALQLPDNDFGMALSTLEELKKGTDVFSFVTPFTEYSSLSLEGYSTTFETSTSMMIIGLQCKEIIEVEQGYTNVTVTDATPIGESDSKNPDNTDTTNTGMTGSSTPTEEEEKQGNESIIYRTGGVIVPGTQDNGGNGGGGGGI